MARRRASIIIPNYNGRQHLERLLPSIANQTFDDYEVIIVDDCSSDRSAVDYVQAYIESYPNMFLVENEQNLGFAQTCNTGFGLAKGEYVCILTNDTTVKENFVERNVQILDQDSSIGVLSCLIVDEHGKNWFSGGTFRAGVRANRRDDFQGTRPVDWVAGTACFYRRALLDRVGLLDETFVMYHEDIDFCLRVRQRTDYKVCSFSEKLVTHYMGHGKNSVLDSSKRLRICYYGHRNHMLLLKRYSPLNIPKVLLRYLFDIVILAILPLTSFRRLNLSYFRFSVKAVVFTVKGTIDGLCSRQNG